MALYVPKRSRKAIGTILFDENNCLCFGCKQCDGEFLSIDTFHLHDDAMHSKRPNPMANSTVLNIKVEPFDPLSDVDTFCIESSSDNSR